MHRLTIAAIAAVSTIALTQIASAADLPRKAPAYIPPAPVPIADWSGVYGGLEGGYGWGKQTLNATSPGDCFANCFLLEFLDNGGVINGGDPAFFPDVTLGSVKQRGWLFGGFFGVQKQWGSWVLGIEGDIDGANIKGSTTESLSSSFDVTPAGVAPSTCLGCLTLNHSLSVDSKIDMLGSLRGKVGFVPAPDWLIYGTGGLAFAHVKTNFSESETFTEVNSKGAVIDSGTRFSFNGSNGDSIFGWAAGAGVDWKFWHDAGSAWILGVEYLHYGFGNNTLAISDNGNNLFTGPNLQSTEKVDTIKGRISYLFSIH